MGQPWNEIKTSQDVAHLLGSFGDFHDSILRECKYCAGAYVDSDLVLNFNSRTHLRCAFQRQRPSPSAIEVVFGNVDFFQVDAGCEDVITEAFITLLEGKMIWSEVPGGDVNLVSTRSGTFIRAESISWRVMDQWIGIREHYTAVTADDIDYYDPESTSISPPFSARLPGSSLE